MKSSKIFLAADLGAEADGSSPVLSTATASKCARSTVLHLYTRILDGKKTLLFGPFAAWTTKFLQRKGSFFDLPLSVKPSYLATLIKICIHNLDLIQYLVQQGTQSMADRMTVLRVFHPAADAKDWKLIEAGIRVQAIEKTDGEAGIVHYGAEVISNSERTILRTSRLISRHIGLRPHRDGSLGEMLPASAR